MKTLFALLLAFAVLPAQAKPIAQVSQGNVRVIFTDEPCALQGVSNLKFRGIWLQDGKTFEGCWQSHQQFAIVITYWEDLTIGIIPLEAVSKTTES